MITRRTTLSAAVSALLYAHAGVADVIEMKNGDRLTGKVVAKAGDTLTVNTAYGELALKWSEVARLSTDESAEIMLDDKTLLTGTVSGDGEGAMKIESPVIRETAPIDLARVSYINPPPEVSGRGLKLNARVNVGAARYTGNTDTQTVHVDGEAVARSLVNRYTVGALYNQSEDNGVETANNSTGYMKYDHFFSEKWYGYVNGIFNKDKFKDLNLRTAVGPGVGYQVFESEEMNLSLEGGLNYVNEDFIAAEDDSYGAGRWALNFDRYLIPEKLQFFHAHELLFGLEDTDNLLLRTQTGLRVPLFSGITGTAQINYDWDKSPPPGAKKADTGYLFTLGYAM